VLLGPCRTAPSVFTALAAFLHGAAPSRTTSGRPRWSLPAPHCTTRRYG